MAVPPPKVLVPTPSNLPIGNAFTKCLDEKQVKALANREIQCQKLSIDLDLTKKAYEDSIKAPHQNEAWWADPKIVIGGFVVTAALTALVTYAVVNESK